MLLGIAATLTGRLVDEPRVRFAPDGEALAEFDLGPAEWLGDRSRVRVRLPEGALDEGLHRGRLVEVRGRIRHLQWVKEGRPRAAVLLEATEARAVEQEPARKPAPPKREPAPAMSEAERVARLRALLDLAG